MSIPFPDFTHEASEGVELDGYMLRAIRIAADNTLDPDPTGLACGEKQVSYRYRAMRQGDIIFVRIEYEPESCGGNDMLDAGATYAIRVDGTILRRSLDGGGP